MVAALTPLPQQGGDRCAVEIETTPGTVTHVTRLPDGARRFDAGGGVEATCGDKWVRADSATWFEGRGLLHLYGNVRFRDPGRSLEADRATYFQNEDRLRPEGNVRFVETESGSTLTGPVLDYYPANAQRPVERIFAPRRPHLRFYPEAPDGGRGEAFDVDADRIHIYGDSALAGDGDVVVTRANLEATGDSLDLDLAHDRLWLLGEPEVVTNATSLVGDTILAILEEGEVREIQAWPDASAVGEDLTLTAPLLRLFVAGGEINRTVAAAGEPERTGIEDVAERAPWASARSPDFTLVADSIDILRPGGQLDRVVSIGRARAAARELVVPGDSLLGRNWISGDTVTGFFAAADSAVSDSSAAGTEARLQRLVAAGDARALHVRLPEDGGPGGRPDINYVLGPIVTLWIGGGEVDSATVIGPATGVYAEAIGIAADTARAAADTTGEAAGADTAGTGRDTVPRPEAPVHRRSSRPGLGGWQ